MLIAPIGNSPTFLSTALARRAIPEWQALSVAIFRDEQANKAWGWVQEMYAFAFALYNLGVRKTLLAPELAAQPPWDTEARAKQGEGELFYMIHYTYGMDYARNGSHMRGSFGEWRFDKRTYAGKAPPRHLGAPPEAVANPHVRALVSAINEATEAIPCWEAYRALGRLAECGDERAKEGSVWVGVEEAAEERRRRRRRAAAGESAAASGG
jgi:hydroxyproline O-arabinosyltransferase